MSLRWRKSGELLCGAKSQELEDDTYIDDRLHYQLSVVLAVVVPAEDEATTGHWCWSTIPKETEELQALRKTRDAWNTAQAAFGEADD